MSNIVLQPNASGTGSIIITTPNTNTDRTLNIPDVAGNLVTTGDTGSISNTMIAGMAASKLTGTLPDGQMPAGTVVQAVRNIVTRSSHWSTASTSWIEFGGMTVTITPKFSNSLIYITCQAFMHCQQDSTRFSMTYFCNGSNIAATTQTTVCYYGSGADTATNTYDSFVMGKWHSPGSTSAQTYSLRGQKQQGSQSMYLHEGGDNFMMAMEIKQ